MSSELNSAAKCVVDANADAASIHGELVSDTTTSNSTSDKREDIEVTSPDENTRTDSRVNEDHHHQHAIDDEATMKSLNELSQMFSSVYAAPDAMQDGSAPPTNWCNNAIPLIDSLTSLLERTAQTGETVVSWELTKPLLLAKFDSVLNTLEQTSSCEVINGESFEIHRDRIRNAIADFQTAPWTLQRLVELLLYPLKYNRDIERFMVSFSKMVNGIRSSPNRVHLTSSAHEQEFNFAPLAQERQVHTHIHTHTHTYTHTVLIQYRTNNIYVRVDAMQAFQNNFMGVQPNIINCSDTFVLSDPPSRMPWSSNQRTQTEVDDENNEEDMQDITSV